MGTLELLSQAVDSMILSNVTNKMAKYKAAIMLLLTPGFDLFNFVQVGGSEAKKHYGFSMFDKSKKVRDLDVVIRNGFNDHPIHALFELLQECSDKLITGYTGSNSSIPMYFEKEQKYKTALYSFAYSYEGTMRWVEVFANQPASKNNASKFVPLKQLVECAQEWKREKDYHFLKQVFALTTGITAPVNVEQIAYDEFLLVDPLNTETKNLSLTTFNLNRLASIMGISRDKLQDALHNAHDVTWICPAQHILSVGEVRYLTRIFNKE